MQARAKRERDSAKPQATRAAIRKLEGILKAEVSVALCLCILVVTGVSPAQAPPDLDTVLQQATEYVTRYEADLGNLIGTEEYTQTASWVSPTNRLTVAQKARRHLSSDFLIIQVGTDWIALRKVNSVDGFKEKQIQPDFEDAFDTSPEANVKRLESMKTESARYNVGDVHRDMNLPTFALKVLRKNEVSRFSFERAGTDKIEGIRTWEIRFRERTGRTLVFGGKGEPLYSHGSLWIDPGTGRVLRTEFDLENPYSKPPIKGTTTVTYTEGKKVQMLVPNLMAEHYETELHTIDCRADYSNFRPFEVDVKFEIASPKP
jgi:hypothetical protein